MCFHFPNTLDHLFLHYLLTNVSCNIIMWIFNSSIAPRTPWYCGSGRFCTALIPKREPCSYSLWRARARWESGSVRREIYLKVVVVYMHSTGLLCSRYSMLMMMLLLICYYCEMCTSLNTSVLYTPFLLLSPPGAFGRLRQFTRHEGGAKVLYPQSVRTLRAAALSPHLLQPAGSARLREPGWITRQTIVGHKRGIGGVWICMIERGEVKRGGL